MIFIRKCHSFYLFYLCVCVCDRFSDETGFFSYAPVIGDTELFSFCFVL
jgi:hypothetical protein